MRSTEISTKDLDRIYWDAVITTRGVKREKRFHPTPGLWCSNCDFVTICPSRMKGEQLATAGDQLELWDDLNDDPRGKC